MMKNSSEAVLALGNLRVGAQIVAVKVDDDGTASGVMLEQRVAGDGHRWADLTRTQLMSTADVVREFDDMVIVRLTPEITLPALQARVLEINKANGWHSEPAERTVDHEIATLALITTEVAEAIEEIRNGHSSTETYYPTSPLNQPTSVLEAGVTKVHKPEGVPSELADVVIRALHFAGARGIDLQAEILHKLDYNATRGIRHGGKAL